jgi:hypothetical protein
VILVQVRCKARGCGKLLASITAPPADYSGWLLIPECRKHGKAHAMLARRRERGENWEDLALPVPWETLRPAVHLSESTKRAEVHTV